MIWWLCHKLIVIAYLHFVAESRLIVGDDNFDPDVSQCCFFFPGWGLSVGGRYIFLSFFLDNGNAQSGNADAESPQSITLQGKDRIAAALALTGNDKLPHVSPKQVKTSRGTFC